MAFPRVFTVLVHNLGAGGPRVMIYRMERQWVAAGEVGAWRGDVERGREQVTRGAAGGLGAYSSKKGRVSTRRSQWSWSSEQWPWGPRRIGYRGAFLGRTQHDGSGLVVTLQDDAVRFVAHKFSLGIGEIWMSPSLFVFEICCVPSNEVINFGSKRRSTQAPGPVAGSLVRHSGINQRCGFSTDRR